MAEPATDRRLVSLATAAEYTGLCTATVRRMVSRGELTGYRLGKRTIRVDLNEVDRLLRPIATGGAAA